MNDELAARRQARQHPTTPTPSQGTHDMSASPRPYLGHINVHGVTADHDSPAAADTSSDAPPGTTICVAPRLEIRFTFADPAA